MKSVIIAALSAMLVTSSLAARPTVSAPTVPAKIKRAVRYPAAVTVSLPKGAKITRLNWYWSGEGPFKYPYRRKRNKLTSRLYTGNPGNFQLQAEVCYRSGGQVRCRLGKQTLIKVR